LASLERTSLARFVLLVKKKTAESAFTKNPLPKQQRTLCRSSKESSAEAAKNPLPKQPLLGGMVDAEIHVLPKQIHASASTADGRSHTLGILMPTDSVLTVKQKLATLTEMSIARQSLYLIDDCRAGDGTVDLELSNDDILSVVQGYVVSKTRLQFAVMLGLKNDNASKFVEDLPPSAAPTLILGDRIHTGAMMYPRGVAFVPAYPELMVLTVCNHNQVRVYHRHTGALLCSMGKENFGHGDREGEFYFPWGVAVTSDSSFVVVADGINHRLQLLRLIATADSSNARLEFVRIIGTASVAGGGNGSSSCTTTTTATTTSRSTRTSNAMSACPATADVDQGGSSMSYPRGVATRMSKGCETVLVVDCGNHRLLEFGLDGTFIRAIGGAKQGRNNTAGADEGGGQRPLHQGCLNQPMDVTVLDSSDEVAVADTMNKRIAIFDCVSGDFVRAVCGRHHEEGADDEGSDEGLDTLSYFCAITTDSHNNLLTLSSNSNHLQVFSPTGELLNSRADLAAIEKDDHKAIAWSADGDSLAIANSTRHNTAIWRAPPPREHASA
jgi:hypothetical protein